MKNVKLNNSKKKVLHISPHRIHKIDCGQKYQNITKFQVATFFCVFILHHTTFFLLNARVSQCFYFHYKQCCHSNVRIMCNENVSNRFSRTFNAYTNFLLCKLFFRVPNASFKYFLLIYFLFSLFNTRTHMRFHCGRAKKNYRAFRRFPFPQSRKISQALVKFYHARSQHKH